MKRIAVAVILGGLTFTPASSDNPYALPGSSANAVPRSLGDIMGLTQLRHIKLFYAGKAQNWPLAGYVLQQLEDTFNDAAVLYTSIPIEQIIALNEPLKRLRDAVRERSPTEFAVGYQDLTNACNSCHIAGQVGFIRMQSPVTSPFSDQNFSPATRQ